MKISPAVPAPGGKSQLCTRHASCLASIPLTQGAPTLKNESSTDRLLKYTTGKKIFAESREEFAQTHETTAI